MYDQMAMRYVIVLAVWVSFAPLAHAEPETVVVISEDSAFRTAVTAMLSPGITVQVAADPAPASAEITTSSRAIADREHATAIVWLLFVTQTATLITYDRTVDRLLVRSLPYGSPLGDAQAAEAARVTRTMLRALRVEDAPIIKPPAPPPIEPQLPVIVVAPPVPSRLAIDLDGGVRMRGPGVTAAPFGALGVIWRPDRLGVVLAGRLAPAATIDGMVLGRVSDQSLALLARWPLAVAPSFAVVSTLGVALHRIAIDGTVDGTPVQDRSYDPAARVGALGSYALNPSVGLGIAVSVDWLLRRQAYEVGTAEVLTVPNVQVSVGLVLLVRIL